MNTLTAGKILARLSAHYPQVGSSDDIADDWLRAIQATTEPVATEAIDQMITTWSRDRSPRIADWQDTCRHIQRRHHLEQPRAIDPPRKNLELNQAWITQIRAELHTIPRWKRQTIETTSTDLATPDEPEIF